MLLWGTEEQCKSARRSRDEIGGRPFDAARYKRSNAEAFQVYGTADFDDFRIEVFNRFGAQRLCEDIVTEMMARISG